MKFQFWMYDTILTMLKDEEAKLARKLTRSYKQTFNNNKFNYYGQICLSIQAVTATRDKHSSDCFDALSGNTKEEKKNCPKCATVLTKLYVMIDGQKTEDTEYVVCKLCNIHFLTEQGFAGKDW